MEAGRRDFSRGGSQKMRKEMGRDGGGAREEMGSGLVARVRVLKVRRRVEQVRCGGCRGGGGDQSTHVSLVREKTTREREELAKRYEPGVGSGQEEEKRAGPGKVGWAERKRGERLGQGERGSPGRGEGFSVLFSFYFKTCFEHSFENRPSKQIKF
jgi:hypothetical protein